MSVERIELPRLRELIDEGGRLIEVLPAQEFADEHLPGAVNVPLDQLDASSVTGLDRRDPLVVYCWDHL